MGYMGYKCYGELTSYTGWTSYSYTGYTGYEVHWLPRLPSTQDTQHESLSPEVGLWDAIQAQWSQAADAPRGTYLVMHPPSSSVKATCLMFSSLLLSKYLSHNLRRRLY